MGGATTTTEQEQSTAGKVISCKAAVAWNPGQNLVIETIDVAPPRAGEVRIRITHATICHSDLMLMGSTEGSRSVFPRIVGHEAAGIVESVGDGVTDLKAGDHVLPLFIGQCNKCEYCKSPKTNGCAIFNVNSVRGTMLGDNTSRFSQNGKVIYHGFSSAFSEYTVVERGYVVKINPAAPLDSVLLLSCGAATGLVADVTGMGSVWKVAKVEKGATVGIFGLGTVGLGVAEGARVAGASRVIGIDTNNAKSAEGKRFGVTDFVNPKDSEKPVEQIIKEMTNGGVDYAFECIGNTKLMKAAFDSCHDGWGMAIIAGVAPRGVTIELEPREYVDKGKILVGSLYGGFKPQSDVPELVEQYLRNEFQLEPFITHKLPFSEINQAIQLLVGGKSLRTVLQF